MVRVKISPTIAGEYESRDLQAGQPWTPGVHDVPLVTAKEMLDDAEHYAHEHGPDCIGAGLKRAYRNPGGRHDPLSHHLRHAAWRLLDMTLEEQVRQAVARGWCDPRNSHKEMDMDLADAIVAEVIESFRPAPDLRETT